MALTFLRSRPRLARLLRLAVLLVAVLCASTFLLAVTLNEERAYFIKAYGLSRNSRGAEEWLVRDFFGDQRDGFFVDVGAYHYKDASNTYYLEQMLGWSGLAIDAQAEFEADYIKYRPRTRFVTAFVSDRSGDLASFFVPEDNRLMASSNKTFADRYDGQARERKVPTITLNDLLERAKVTRIDFLTMDIELAEPKALAGFDIVRYRPRLVCVESHPEIRQQLLDYFADRQYSVVGRYLRADQDNLWFVPANAPRPKGLEGGHGH